MQIIVVTAKMQISLRVLSVELQASFQYYVRGGYRHSAPLSSVQIENLWICGQSPSFTQTIFGSWGIYKVNLVTQAVWSGSCTCEWRRLTSVCAFDTSLASQRFCDWFCLPEMLICWKFDQNRLWSVCASSQLVWYIFIVNLWRRLKDVFVEWK